MYNSWMKSAIICASIWREAKTVLVLTGAGISVPSGIPDFRSPGGLWERFKPEEVATLQALRSHPEKVWEFLLEADNMFDSAKPNPAHEALAAIESAGHVTAVVTQNIDGLHQRAGSRNVIEFHGSGRRYYCMGCKKDYPAEQIKNLTPADIPLRCDACGDVVRPDFVFFNEQIPVDAMKDAFNLADRADLIVIVGTSGEVAPANSLPLHVKRNGGKVIEINRGFSNFGNVTDIRVIASAEEALPVISESLTA